MGKKTCQNLGLFFIAISICLLGFVASCKNQAHHEAAKKRIADAVGFHQNDLKFLAEGSSGFNESRLIFNVSPSSKEYLNKFSKINDRTSLDETTEMIRDTLEAGYIKGDISDVVFEYRGETYTFFMVTVGGRDMIVYFGGL